MNDLTAASPTPPVPAPTDSGEVARLESLRSFDILDTDPEGAFDDITALASYICKTPIALITLVDAQRQWFKSRQNFPMPQTSREISFCSHVVAAPQGLMIVPDTLRDERFANNPIVTGHPHVRFYAGAPLVSAEGYALGTVCVFDQVPRDLTEKQLQALGALSRQTMLIMELRRVLRERRDYETKVHEYQQQLENAVQRLEKIAVTDSLTGLNNHGALAQRLEEEVQRARRYDAPLSLVMFDVDFFKGYNDSFGHLAGDEVLRRLADILLQHARPSDFAARYGGEEFAIILGDTALKGALKQAERLRQAVEEKQWPHREVRVSVGAAELTSQIADGTAFLAAADAALYRAKNSGRNRVSG